MEKALNTEIKIKKVKDVKTYKLIWELIKYRPGLYLGNCILWIMVHCSPIIPGLIAKEFFDTLSGKATLNVGIWGIIALTVASTLGSIVLISCGANTDITHRFTMSALLRRNLLEAILKRPGAASLPYSVGEAVNCFNEDAKQAEDSISWTLDVIGSATFAIIAMGILLNINARITIFVFTPLVAVVAIAQIASEKLERYRKASREATGNVTGILGEIFDSVQAIKVSGAEDQVIKHVGKLNKTRQEMMTKDSVLNQVLDSIFNNTVSLGTGLVLLLVGQSMRMGHFSVGDFAVFIYYLTFVADFTHFFGSFLAHYRQTGISFDRMHELLCGYRDGLLVKHNKISLRSATEIPYFSENINRHKLNEMEVRRLSYVYENGTCGINEVDFSVKKGTFTVITGRIGSGKTTLVKTLIGLLESSSGEIYWNGERVMSPSEFLIPPICAYTAQVPHLFSESVRNNILLGLKEDRAKLNKAINSAVLDEDIDTFENGLDTIIGPRGIKLSGGQIQRVAAARMFMRDAELLVLDDISSALDVETETKLWNRNYEIKDKTYIVVSNKRLVLQRADNIIVMKDGHVEAQGTLNELLETCEEMKQIWGDKI